MTNNESGRSMVEMLGVLAIIGVLSVGGIAGYTMAMNKHRANEIVDVGSKLIIAAETSSNGYATVSNIGLTEPIGGCANTFEAHAKDNSYGSKVVRFMSCDADGGVIKAVKAMLGPVSAAREAELSSCTVLGQLGDYTFALC